MTLNLKKLSVLVVEDIMPMRTLLSDVLQSLNVGTILTAPSGEAGLQLFCKQSPDIVIADWHMEPMDGIALTSEIRTNPLSPNRMAPVIMITGFASFSRIATARDAGVTEYLIKPFSAHDLAKRLSYVISKPRNFIDAPEYFGPDRRRKRNPHYAGPFCREDDPVKNT